MPKHKFERGQIVKHWDGSIYVVDSVVEKILYVSTVYEASEFQMVCISRASVIEILGQVEP